VEEGDHSPVLRVADGKTFSVSIWEIPRRLTLTTLPTEVAVSSSGKPQLNGREIRMGLLLQSFVKTA
jgi:hypothetical protein